MELVGHLEWWIQAGKGYPESLKSLEVGDMSWQPVPVADGLRIKRVLVCFVACSWHKRWDPLLRWSLGCMKSGLMSMMPCWILNGIVIQLMYLLC